MARILTSIESQEISKDTFEAGILVELAAGSPIGTLYLAHRDINWGGKSYQNRLVSVAKISGGTINIGEQIPSQRSFAFTVEDSAGTLASQPVSTYLNKTVTVREVIAGLNSSIDHAFVVRKIASTKPGELTFNCVDAFSIQTYPDLPRLYIDTNPFPKVDASLLGATVPVIHGTKKIPLILVDKGDPDTLAPAKFLIGAGTYTVASAWELEYALPTSAYSVVTSTSAFTHTMLYITNPENIYGPGGRVSEFFAAVTRTDAPAPYGGLSNTPTNVFYDYWTNAEYGLGNSSADLDATYFTSATQALETAHEVPIRFNCRIDEAQSFSSLLANLLFSCHSWVTTESTVKFHHYENVINTSGFDESNIVGGVQDVGITMQSRDLSRVFNDFYLTYENANEWSQSISEQRGPQIETQNHTISSGDGGTDSIGTHSQGIVHSYFVGDSNVAQIIGKLHIIELANALTEVSFTTDITGKTVEVLDRVPVSWDLYKWDNQYVRITNIDTDGETYTFNGYTTVVEGATTASILALGDNKKPAPVNVSNVTLNSTFGTMLGKWNPVADLSVRRYHIQIGDGSTSATVSFASPFIDVIIEGTTFPFGGVTGDWYQIRVKAVDVFNQESNSWSTSNVAKATTVSASDLDIDWIKQTYIDFSGIATPYIVANNAAILGTLTVGSPLIPGSAATIQSYNYNAGTSGWTISYDGSAEFNDVTIRGALDGATGTFSGIFSVSGSQGIVNINPDSFLYLFNITKPNGDMIFRASNTHTALYVGGYQDIDASASPFTIGINAVASYQAINGRGGFWGGIFQGIEGGGAHTVANPGNVASATSPFSVPRSVLATTYGGYSADLLYYAGINQRAVLGIAKQPGTENVPHLRLDSNGLAQGVRTGNPNGSVTGKWGDFMLWKDGSTAKVSLCNGNGGGQNTYGTQWSTL
jgi:hypothetical protein